MKLIKLTEFHADSYDDVKLVTEKQFTAVSWRGYQYYVGGESCQFAIRRLGNTITVYALVFDDD